jgi:hypothetical protein
MQQSCTSFIKNKKKSVGRIIQAEAHVSFEQSPAVIGSGRFEITQIHKTGRTWLEKL